MAIVCSSTAYEINIFTLLAFSGFSTIHLVLCTKIMDLLNLIFPLLEQITASYSSYLFLLKGKAEFIKSILLDYKTQLIQDRVLDASMYHTVKKFFQNEIWYYLLAWHTSSLHTGTANFQEDYVGPLVIDTVLDSTQYKLTDLKNRKPRYIPYQ